MNSDQIIETLDPYVTQNKKGLIDQVLEGRTRHITLVFEDIAKPHNISAVLRTAECFGLQDVHFIKNRNEYTLNPGISGGASKWLTLHHYNEGSGSENVQSCFDFLRSQGYRIYATALALGSEPISSIDAHDQPIAIVFGTETEGVSEDVINSVDGLFQIPMKGFTESFNLSVSAAIIVNTLFRQETSEWLLNEAEKKEIKANWYRQIVKRSDIILENLING